MKIIIHVILELLLHVHQPNSTNTKNNCLVVECPHNSVCVQVPRQFSNRKVHKDLKFCSHVSLDIC